MTPIDVDIESQSVVFMVCYGCPTCIPESKEQLAQARSLCERSRKVGNPVRVMVVQQGNTRWGFLRDSLRRWNPKASMPAFFYAGQWVQRAHELVGLLPLK